jgi:hypothetical protein
MDEKGEIIASLRRLEASLEILVKAQLAPVAEVEFANQKMATLYELTGHATQPEIKKRLRISANTISDTWKRWERLGLLVKDGQRYRKVL